MHRDVIMNRICYDRMKVRVILTISIKFFLIGANLALSEITGSQTNTRHEAPIT